MSRLPDPESLSKAIQEQLQGVDNLDALEAVRIAWLGRKEGRLTLLMKELGQFSIEEKREWGPKLNMLKASIEASINAKDAELQSAQRRKDLESSTIDITLPGSINTIGRAHPISQVITALVDIFKSMGFVCADGPEIESEFNNFDALNVPPDHPARDMQDTFYLKNRYQQLSLPEVKGASRGEPVLLRTHTSPVQVHVMKKYAPPLAIIAPGRVYRNEAQDATHLATFHQMEGLMVDQNLSFADLKGTLSRFAQLFFAPTVRTRFKPSYFPFTEPSAQMDVSCWQCDGNGCKTCKQQGWIELLGAGMVNPKVLEAVNIDAEKYTGFAFGMGIERLAMLKFGIDDLRLFYENDVRFLQQF